MARTMSGPRKSEHLGIPVDRDTKRRLKRVATAKKLPHTELARGYVVDGIDRDERQLPAEK